ncbi:hypothetical protein C8R47DRAFT_1086971 [Mycena vitilis]|nr:hypothetical protein C8R47DRAFT_1086971 [Mycena vitilis]
MDTAAAGTRAVRSDKKGAWRAVQRRVFVGRRETISQGEVFNFTPSVSGQTQGVEKYAVEGGREPDASKAVTVKRALRRLTRESRTRLVLVVSAARTAPRSEEQSDGLDVGVDGAETRMLSDTDEQDRHAERKPARDSAPCASPYMYVKGQQAYLLCDYGMGMHWRHGAGASSDIVPAKFRLCVVRTRKAFLYLAWDRARVRLSWRNAELGV